MFTIFQPHVMNFSRLNMAIQKLVMAREDSQIESVSDTFGTVIGFLGIIRVYFLLFQGDGV